MDKKAIRRWDRAFYFPNAIRVLRIKQALITSAFMLYSMAGFSQQDKMVTFGADKEALPKALKRLAKAADVLIGYPAGETEKAGKVSLQPGQRTLGKTLELLLKGTGLSFRFVDGRVVIYKPVPVSPGQDEPQRKLINITGKVVDETGQPLPAITILLQGTDRGTTTNGSGAFELDQVPEDGSIVAQGVGFPAQAFNAAAVMVLQLNRSVSDLDEVQVIAYGTTTRRISTGSISSITAKDLATQPVSNPLAAMQGRIPGLAISQTSGIAGSAFNVQLRGQSALDLSLSKNDPLFVIDGVPFEPGNSTTNQLSSAATQPSGGGLSALNLLNPADIERIDVLKDADATSIYGSRGANGVILITTKKGVKKDTEASIRYYSGISQLGKTPAMLTAAQYLMMRREAFTNDSITMTPQNAPDLLLWDTTRYTDFKELLIGNNASVNNVNVGISGGTDRTQFRASAGYRSENSVFVKSLTDKVATVSLNVNHRTADDRLSLNLSAVYGNDRNRLPRRDLSQYLTLPPNLKLYNDDGSLAWDEGSVTFLSLNLTNPLAQYNDIVESENENLSANLNIVYTILKSLAFKLNTGYNSFSTNERNLSPSTSISPHATVLPSAQFSNNTGKSWIIEPQVEWKIAMASSALTILAGSTLQQRKQEGISTTGTNYRSDLLLPSIAGAGNITSRNRYSLYRYSAFFGRINYNYQNKYMISLTGRRDGSGRFGPDNRWANFGAAGAAWTFTNEKFMKNADMSLSFGKIRASYGTTGNDQIGDYKYLNLWQNTPSTYDGHDGLMPIGLYNPDYSWEINKKLEIGLDLGFLKDKVNMVVNYFRNRSDNQLINYSLAGQTGFYTVVRNFPGLVQNTGIESVISANFRWQSLSWSSAINVTLPKNELLAFPDIENSSYRNNYVVGSSLSVIQGYKYTGVDPQTGIYTFVDKNGDGEVWDRPDYFMFGDRDPDLYGGFQNTLHYKNWALNAFIHFTKQKAANYIAQFPTPPGRLANQPELVLERWTNAGDLAPVQRFTTTTGSRASAAVGILSLSDGAYTDASFARLKNVSVAYTLNALFLKKMYARSARIFLEGQNLVTVTNYKGPDPETQNFYVLPPLRVLVAGIEISF